MDGSTGGVGERNAILFLGGTRSGKSQRALERTRMEADETVTFLATAREEDEEMRKRIENHRSERPDHWRTVEPEYDFIEEAQKLVNDKTTVLFDEVSLLVSDWVSRGMDRSNIYSRFDDFLGLVGEGGGTWIMVSAIVGQSPVPDNEITRTFRDVLGRINQQLAETADEVYEVKAGLLNRLKPNNNRDY